MKGRTGNFLAILIVCVALMGISGSSVMAQGATTNFQINGELLTAITISKTTDLNFGKFAKTGAGTVVIAAATGARTQTASVSLQGGTTSRAAFNITGQANYFYSITMTDGAAAATVQTGAGGLNETMTVDLVINGAKTARQIDGAGNHTIEIGGTLNVGAAQVNGVYALPVAHSINVAYD